MSYAEEQTIYFALEQRIRNFALGDQKAQNILINIVISKAVRENCRKYIEPCTEMNAHSRNG